MNRPKYRININHLESQGACQKLERDGYTRHDIIREMYKVTDGATTQERENIVNKLYDRSEKY